jgi:hypothetical protein
MRTRLVAGLGLWAVLLAGCSSTPPAKTEPIEATVTVTLPNGQPGGGLALMMLPTSSDQIQGGGKTDAKGKVKTKLTPGKYTFAFDGPPATVPKKYHSNDAANSIDVTPTSTNIELKLEK